jgi:hypothetical protein
MSTHDARSTTLGDFGIDPSVVAHEHAPRLFPRERFVRCTSCGVTVPYSVTAEGPIRRALEELSMVTCGEYELPDVPVGEHVPTVTPERPGQGRSVVCESCGRTAQLSGDRERVLEELAAIPCIEQLSHTELVNLVFSPTTFTPPLPELGIANWYGRDGRGDGDVRRVFRHERFQFTVYIRATAGGTYEAAVSTSPNAGQESFAELQFPNADPSDPTTRDGAATLVTFLAATDSLTAGEFSKIKTAYEDAYESHREAWLDDAYEKAREKFDERFNDTPEGFTGAFADATADSQEVLRRLVGSGGFEDLEEPAFAREILGHDHEFPGLVDFVADNHGWSPPVPDG